MFGPVAAIIAADDEADAIRIANDSEFGLGSGVLTADLDRGRRIAAEELEAGMSFVNENVRSDPRAPFGGVKHSGYGRECGVFGIREFVNIKTVHVKELGAGGARARPNSVSRAPSRNHLVRMYLVPRRTFMPWCSVAGLGRPSGSRLFHASSLPARAGSSCRSS